MMPNGTIAVGTDGAVSVDGGVVGELGIFVAPATQLIPEGADQYRVNDTRTLEPGQEALPLLRVSLKDRIRTS